jgi:uncharacterized protein YaaN involved in tellurite resistance
MTSSTAKPPLPGEWSASDLKKIDDLASKIDLADAEAVLQFGTSAQRQISSFSDRVLSHARAKDAGHVRDLLEGLMRLMKRLNVARLQEDGVLARIPILGTRMGVSDRFFTEYEKVSTQIERLSERLEEERDQLLKDVELFDKLYEQNLEHNRQLEIYIVAAERRLEGLDRDAARAEGPSTSMEQHRLEESRLQVHRLLKKIDELKLTRTVSIQTAGQIRLIQNGVQVLIEGIQGAILNSVPVWRTQIAIAMAHARRKRTLKLRREVAEATRVMVERSTTVLDNGGADAAAATAKPSLAHDAAGTAAEEPTAPASGTAPAPVTMRAVPDGT